SQEDSIPRTIIAKQCIESYQQAALVPNPPISHAPRSGDTRGVLTQVLFESGVRGYSCIKIRRTRPRTEGSRPRKHALGKMKEFKLTAWPELPAPYQRIAYRRMLSDMSHRFVTAHQLCESSGASKLEVRVFLQMLSERGLLHERDHEETQGLFGPLGGWIRRD